MPFGFRQAEHIFHIADVCQFVEIDDLLTRQAKSVKNEITTDGTHFALNGNTHRSLRRTGRDYPDFVSRMRLTDTVRSDYCIQRISVVIATYRVASADMIRLDYCGQHTRSIKPG